MIKFWCKLIFLGILFSCGNKNQVPTIIELNNDWKFTESGKSNWLNAEVPGNIFSDIKRHGIIPDPFIGDNEKKVQWVSDKDWIYETRFALSDAVLSKKNAVLRFGGLDTYASVYLNDSLIISTNNAFRTYELDVKLLIESENRLRIVFENSGKYEEAAKSKLNYELPEGNRVFTRKAQFQYGWDWGPKLNTSGIWRPVSLMAYDEVRITDVFLKQEILNDSIAHLVAKIETENADSEEVLYEVFVDDELIGVQEGSHAKTIVDFEIKNPKRWWPHNIGDPHLYIITIKAKKNGILLDQYTVQKGLRTVKLITQKDSWGESFYFEINDVPVYCKGANYIPQNSLQNQVRSKDYENLLNDVVEANMNMLRVWGGGIYENDIFYDLCDQKGIMLWQDFMFACAMYPGDMGYFENVRAEANGV